MLDIRTVMSKDKWPASGRRLDSVGALRHNWRGGNGTYVQKVRIFTLIYLSVSVFDTKGTLLTCCLRDARYYEIDTNIRRNPGVLRLERMEMSSAVIFGSACFALTAVVVM
jgi:hypothetical protein